MKNLTGRRFGRLTVLEPLAQDKAKVVLWRCRCDCGNLRVVRSSSLLSGRTRSCGCLQKEVAATLKKTHGMSKSSEHRSWDHMLQRCENPNDKKYPSYGGRGIQVCDRWHKFESFYQDMGPKPGPKYSIDRINNDSGYELGNCRWATPKEQAGNKRPVSTGPRKQKCFYACNCNTMIVFSSNNQHQFARDHDLCNSSISLCLNNQQRSHKGWTFSYCPSN